MEKKQEAKSEQKTEKEVKEVKQENKILVMPKAGESGLLIGKDLGEQYRLAQYYCNSKLLPTRFTTPEMILTAMQYCYELGLKPLTGMRQIAVINGTPSFFGDLPLAVVKNSGQLKSIKEFTIAEDGREICFKNKNLNAKPFGAICVVKRKGETEEVERTWTMADADTAKLTNKDVWKSYPKTMLKYRARAMALKDCFPDILNGLSIAEYDFNELPRNDNDVVIATSQEVRDDLDHSMSDYKKALLADIKILWKNLTEISGEYNGGRQTQVYLKYCATEDIAFAKEENLETLKSKLSIFLEGERGKALR